MCEACTFVICNIPILDVIKNILYFTNIMKKLYFTNIIKKMQSEMWNKIIKQSIPKYV